MPSLIYDKDVNIQEDYRDMSFWDDIKNFTKPYAVDDDYDDFDEEMDEAFAEEEPAPRFGSRREAPAAPVASADTGFGSNVAAPAVTTNTTAFTPVSTGFSGQVINTSTSAKQQVILTRPESFNDAPTIATNLRNKKAVVLNLENVDKALARRVVDFLSGCTYALDGSVKKISQATYLFCPYNMEVLGDLKNLQGEVESYV